MLDSTGYAELCARVPTLYHRVWDSDGKLDSILAHGLERVESNYSGFFESRPGCVYMGDREKVLTIRPEADDAKPWTLLAIDTTQLERQRINPDEDDFMCHNFCDAPVARAGERACRRMHLPWPPSQWLWEWARWLKIPLPNLGEWSDAVGLGDDPAATRFGIACGRLAYRGVVPPGALRVVETVRP
jgi:hypothetical protein